MRHKSGLKTHMLLIHLSLYLRTRGQGGDRIYDNYIYAPRLNKRLDNIKRLFTGIRLRNQKLIYFYTNFLSIVRIQSMLSINKSRYSTHLLRFRNNMKT